MSEGGSRSGPCDFSTQVPLEQSERGREKSAMFERRVFLKANLNSTHGDTLLPRMT